MAALGVVCYALSMKRGLDQQFQIVAINEPSDLETMAYLTQFDSTHGVFPGKVGRSEDHLLINGKEIAVFFMRKHLMLLIGSV